MRLSFLRALLNDAGIPADVFDANMSALEAGIGAFPRRVMVPAESQIAAEKLLINVDKFYNSIINVYFVASNTYHSEYIKLKNQRSVEKLVDYEEN